MFELDDTMPVLSGFRLLVWLCSAFVPADVSKADICHVLARDGASVPLQVTGRFDRGKGTRIVDLAWNVTGGLSGAIHCGSYARSPPLVNCKLAVQQEVKEWHVSGAHDTARIRSLPGGLQSGCDPVGSTTLKSVPGGHHAAIVAKSMEKGQRWLPWKPSRVRLILSVDTAASPRRSHHARCAQA